MPEGPEIHRVADRLASVLVGHVVTRAEFGLPRLETFSEYLSGKGVKRVEARGKALLIRFDCDLTIYSHNQLYGKWYVVPLGERPSTNRSLRVALHTDRTSALLYSASDIEVLTDRQLLDHPFLCRIGPDILDPAITWQQVSARLDEKRFRRRALAGLYLDQSFLAGVGNYLRSEILHFARVSPRSSPAGLSTGRRNELARQTLAVSERSYRTGGITNLPDRVRRMKREGAARSEYRFAVFGRASRPCPVCSQKILRTEAASRRLYYCPACQAD